MYAAIRIYDQAGAEASTAVARDWVAANLAGASIGAPQVLGGAVAMST